MSALTNIEVFIGRAPLLEVKLAEGLLAFGRAHPQWRFSLRAADFQYTTEWLKEHKIAGALVLIDATNVEEVLNRSRIPWVHLVPPRQVFHPSVNVDDVAIGCLGAEKFMDLGFTRFAFCGIRTEWSDARAQGFETRLAESGYDCERTELHFGESESWTLQSKAEEQLAHWLAGLPKRTAVMAAHDVAATRVVDVCVRNGLRVPDEISVLGVGNHALVCELCPVPLSSIDCDVPQVGVRAALLLQAIIEGCDRDVSQVVAPKGVVERRSTEILGYEDALVRRMVEYIRDRACDGLTVEQLVEKFNMSRRTLARKFSESVGRSPGAEIRLARLRHARRMLTETGQSLTEIAMTCGFADLSHMDRSFRTVFDITPGSLRQR